MKNLMLMLILGSFTLTTSSPAKSLDAHVHGIVHLDIASEKNELLVMLKTPSESLLGFEYKPKTEEEKKKLTSAKTLWNEDLIKLLGKKALGDCKISKVNGTKGFPESITVVLKPNHILIAQNQFSGRVLEVNFKRYYTNIQKINLQLIREDGTVDSRKISKESFNLKL